MTYPKYHARYRNLTAEAPLLGDQELGWQAPLVDDLANREVVSSFPDPSQDPEFKKRQVVREAILLFEGTGGDGGGAKEKKFQDPAYVKLPKTFLNLNRYEDDVVEELFALREEPVRPGALILPDPKLDDWLGCEVVDIEPFLEFEEPQGQLFAEVFLEAMDTDSEDLAEGTLIPLGSTIEDVAGGRRVQVTYPLIRWKREGGWEKRRSWLTRFGLPGLDPEYAEFLTSNRSFLSARYRMRFRLSHPNGGLEFDEIVPVFRGTRSLPHLNERVDLVRLNLEYLGWKGIDPAGQIEKVEIRLTRADRQLVRTVAPRSEGGEWRCPSELTWPVHRLDGDAARVVSAEIVFKTLSGDRRWRGNGVLNDLTTIYLDAE
jgi:hypothetical protein